MIIQKEDLVLHGCADHSNRSYGFSFRGCFLPSNRFNRENDTHNFRSAFDCRLLAARLQNSPSNFIHNSSHGQVPSQFTLF